MPAPRRSTTQQRSRQRPEGEPVEAPAVEPTPVEPTPVDESVTEPSSDFEAVDSTDAGSTDVVVGDAVPVPADEPNDVKVDTRSPQERVEADKLTVAQLVERHARIGHDRFVVEGVLLSQDGDAFTIDEAKALVDEAVTRPIGGDDFDDSSADQTEEV